MVRPAAVVGGFTIIIAAVASWLLSPSPIPDMSHFALDRTTPNSHLFSRDHNWLVRGDGADINAYSRLVENAGPTKQRTVIVVFMHGYPESARITWDSTMSFLEKLKIDARRVVYAALDLRGFNESVVDPGSHLKMWDMSHALDDLGTLVETVKTREHIEHDNNIEVHLVGHDWGGIVGWNAWMNPPSSLKTPIRSLTIINAPHPHAVPKVLRSSDQLFRSWYVLYYQLPTWLIGRSIVGNDVASFKAIYARTTKEGSMSIDAINDLTESVTQPGRLDSMLNWYRNFMRSSFSKDLNNKTTTEVVMKPPVSIIWGLNDFALNPKNLCESRKVALHQNATNVRIYPLPDENHFVPTDNPDVVAKVVADTVNGDLEYSLKYFSNENFCKEKTI